MWPATCMQRPKTQALCQQCNESSSDVHVCSTGVRGFQLCQCKNSMWNPSVQLQYKGESHHARAWGGPHSILGDPAGQQVQQRAHLVP
jgi:hypothetical protein